MPFALVRTVPPSSSPVSLSLAKGHLRVSGTDEDDVIQAMIDGAVSDAQRESGLQFCRATFQLLLDDFPRQWDVTGARAGTILLPVGPVQSVDSVAYVDTAGAAQTVSVGTLWVGLRTGRIVPPVGWPATRRSPECVTITFKAGWPTAGEVPADAVSALLLIVADRYENRGDNVTNFLADRPIPAGALRLLRNLQDAQH